jgi:hypothetical protein
VVVVRSAEMGTMCRPFRASTYLPNENRLRMGAASNPGITTPASIGPFKYEYQFLI